MANYRERFLIVTFFWKEKPKISELKPLFDSALDWMRIAPNCWVLWTNNNAETWRKYVRPYLGSGDSVLVAELNLTEVAENYTGHYAKWVWEWIDKHR